MESIKIEKDGSVSIPKPGNMKITVEMTEGLRRRMNNLASAVIKSAEGKTPKEKKRS